MHALLFGWFAASLHDWSLRLLYAAAIGQTLFVVLWATRPWYRLWIGRALMVKSATLMIYLDWAVLVVNGWSANRALMAVVLFGLITVGIWTQLAALSYEMSRARKSRRNSA